MFAIDNYNFNGKKAIIRVDFNVPLNEKFEITDDTRIRAAVPTVEKILKDGGAVVLMSHLGRPKGVTEKYSLKHIIDHISKLIGKPIQFAADCVSEDAQNKKKALKMGEVLLLENLRFHEEEEGKPRLPETATDEEKKAAKAKVKESQKEFVKKLAANVDVWVNDAFGTAHRAHASTALIADYFPNDRMFGYVIEKELKAIDAFLLNPQHPTTAILGGSKISSKITVIENLLNKVDNLIIGGGMTYTFTKALGGKVGTSLCEDDMLDVAKDILAKAKAKGIQIYFESDSVCGDKFAEDANVKIFPVNQIEDGWMGLDAGPNSVKHFEEVLDKSKQVLWNGPIGVFEIEKFGAGTKAIAKKLAEITKKNGAFTIIGGGDSVAAINKYGLADQVSYVSTGGGALLEYIEGKELPGIKVIRGK